MTLLNLLANITPADIFAFARNVPTPDDFELTRSVVPERKIQNVKYRIKTSEKRVNTAKFRAYDAETPFGVREVTHSITEGMLPPLGNKFLVGELETILLGISRGSDDQDLIDGLYDDVERAVLGIKSRMELAAGDLLVDRKFTLAAENNLTLEADFGVGLAAGFSPVAPILWDAAGATPLTDEQNWISFLRTSGAGVPAEALTSSAVYALLGRNHEYQESYFGRGQTTYPSLNPTQVDGVRATNRLPQIRLYDTTVRVDGVDTLVLPANRFFLLPANKSEFAETQYGITAESLALSRVGNPRIEREDLPGIVVTAQEFDDPVRVITKGAAVAMPVMYAPTAYLPARVLA